MDPVVLLTLAWAPVAMKKKVSHKATEQFSHNKNVGLEVVFFLLKGVFELFKGFSNWGEGLIADLLNVTKP